MSPPAAARSHWPLVRLICGQICLHGSMAGMRMAAPLLALRQGKLSKWFSGIGQEAISVGATLALDEDEWILPLHRNLGVFTSRHMPLHKLFMQWQGSKEGYSKGRERSFHFGTKEHHICGMISHLGPQLAIADGVALAHAQRTLRVAGVGESRGLRIKRRGHRLRPGEVLFEYLLRCRFCVVVEVGEDAGQRCAQLVRGIGDELALLLHRQLLG